MPPRLPSEISLPFLWPTTLPQFRTISGVLPARWLQIFAVLFFVIHLTTLPLRADLEGYDEAVQIDAVLGLNPTAVLTNAVTLTGSNRASFNFGPTSGDVTIEFILEGLHQHKLLNKYALSGRATYTG